MSALGHFFAPPDDTCVRCKVTRLEAATFIGECVSPSYAELAREQRLDIAAAQAAAKKRSEDLATENPDGA